jgi:uncharacterized protein with NRDE domain
MCTLTYFPLKTTKGFILTVNRDESQDRPALAPDYYEEENVKMLYPKDPKKGGTWIGISSQKRVVNLMNGAFKKHQRDTPYRKSRGVIVLDFLKTEGFKECCQSYDFENIEPFTVICLEWKDKLKLYEFRWDGKQRFLMEKNTLDFQVWSASMTYDESQKKERKEFFQSKLKQQHDKKFNAEELWNLHHAKKENDGDLDLIIDRGVLKTTSISQIVRDGDEVSFKFEDLLSGKVVNKTVAF